MQVVLATTNTFMHKGGYSRPNAVLEPLLSWLTEEHDRAERKETWSLLMEIAIVILVAGELTFSAIDFVGHHLR